VVRLSFSHRAARTVEEITEVLEKLELARKACDEPGIGEAEMLIRLQERNWIWQNLECYAIEYVGLLLKYHDLLKQLVYGLSKFGEFAEETRVGGVLKEIEALDLSLTQPKEDT
jgi:hypothetical protein